MPRPKRKKFTDVTSAGHSVVIKERAEDGELRVERLGDFLADLEKRVADIEAHLEWQATRSRVLGSR